MTDYLISIGLNNDNLKWLHDEGMFLCGYKGVNTISHGKIPLWFATDIFSTSVDVGWDDKYGGYVEITSSRVRSIISASIKPMSLGDLMTLQSDGSTTIENDGKPDNINIFSQFVGATWTCGIAQAINGPLVPTCSFNLGYDDRVSMEPLEIIVLEFRPGPITAGTIVESTNGSSMLFDLSGDAQCVSVEYDHTKSPQWNANHANWARSYSSPINLASTLIKSP